MTAKLTELERESRIQHDIRLLIGGRRDCMAIRINTGVFTVGKHTIRTAPTGTHDILCCQLRRMQVRVTHAAHSFNPVEQDVWQYYGQFVSFETKSRTGRKSKEQLAFAGALRARGGKAAFVRSIDEVLAILGPLPDWIDEIPEELQFTP